MPPEEVRSRLIEVDEPDILETDRQQRSEIGNLLRTKAWQYNTYVSSFISENATGKEAIFLIYDWVEIAYTDAYAVDLTSRDGEFITEPP